MQPVFNVHSLLFGLHTSPDLLRTISTKLASIGETIPLGLEVAFAPGLIDLDSGPELAQACIDARLPIKALCVFFGQKDYDPLEQHSLALTRLEKAHGMAQVIGEKTGVTPIITGPWAYQIGKPYPRTDMTFGKVGHFINAVDRMCGDGFPEVKRALEILRPAENFAVQGHQRAVDLLQDKHPNTGVHLDSYHLGNWGEDTDPAKILAAFENRLFWFHVSGQDRRTPGSHPDERIDWSAWANALNKNEVKPGLCLEGFGPEFRDAVPEIGKGFPKDLPALESIKLTLETMRKAGLKI
jgi:sugar phosphate isomerase/epimerase